MRYADDVKKRDFVNRILTHRVAITVAANVLHEITQEEHMKAKRRSQRKYETDMANNYLVGVDVGKAEEKKIWRKKLKALAILSDKQIAEISGLSIAEIEKL
jgi:hypothetical protein